MKMECNCCGTWVHAECEQLSGEDFRLLCTMIKTEYVCSLCCPEKNWATSLRRHANQVFMDILAKLISLDSVSPDQLDTINQKASRNEYRSCAQFIDDIRRLSDLLTVNEFDLLSAMSWMESKEIQIVPRQKISITAKVTYRLDSLTNVIFIPILFF